MTTKSQSTTTKLEGSEPTLEPCKFCGRRSKIEEFFIDDDPQPWYVATCELCPVTTYDQTTPEEAARIWNTRPSANGVPTVDDAEPLTDAQVDAWLEARKNDPVDSRQANRVEWLFRKKLAASIVSKAKEWLRSYDERIAQGGKGAQDMERLYGEEAAFHREVIRAVETLALEPSTAASTVAPAQAAWVSTQDISRDSEADLVRRIETFLVAVPAPSAAIQNETDDLVDEVQHRMDQVVEAAVEWHQAGREGTEWFEAAEKLGAAIDSLLELRDDERSKLNAAASSERCLSEGEALTLDEVQE